MYTDKPKDECGIFGIYNNKEIEDIVNLLHRGLFGLQHRGEEGAGIAVATTRAISLFKGAGLVERLFSYDEPNNLQGHSGIGHVRYSLIGESNTANTQPFAANLGLNPDQISDEETPEYGAVFSGAYSNSPFAVAHNGNFNEGLEACCKGSDTKAFTEMVSKSGEHNLRRAVVNSLRKIDAARENGSSWALLILTPDWMMGARDPDGYRPLSLGRLGNSYVLSSETCAIKDIKAEPIRDIAPGEILFIDKKGLHSEYIATRIPLHQCIFEYIYLARPDSIMFGESVYNVRYRLGRRLAEEHPAKADIVVGVPDSGRIFAKGYAESLGILFESEAIGRSHYFGRIFIQPKHKSREMGADYKFFVNRELVRGKSVVVVDDSRVRGINLAKTVELLKEADAREIHVRVSSPPYISSCYWGVDTYDTSLLVALHKTPEQMASDLKISSLEYLSMDGLLSQLDHRARDMCKRCFERHYNETNKS